MYDSSSGRIVLVHEFIGDGTGLYAPQGREERARITLEDARKHPASPAHLQVLHLEPGFKWAPETLYRVDVSAGKLISHRKLTSAVTAAGPAKSQFPAT
jgi:hypothetical protein